MFVYLFVCLLIVVCGFSYMYYTVRETSNGRIERRDLTGKNPLVLVDSSLSWPNGLDIDFEGIYIYIYMCVCVCVCVCVLSCELAD